MGDKALARNGSPFAVPSLSDVGVFPSSSVKRAFHLSASKPSVTDRIPWLLNLKAEMDYFGSWLQRFMPWLLGLCYGAVTAQHFMTGVCGREGMLTSYGLEAKGRRMS